MSSWVTRRPGEKFSPKVEGDKFESLLEMPDGKNPNQNGWLTITINYTMNFVDSRNLKPGLTLQQNGKALCKA